MKLSPSADTKLVVQIDEKYLSLIVLGQKALASADAKQTFDAEVVYINPGVDLQRASVEVKLNLEQSDGTTFLLVTHNMDLARRCDRIVDVVDGRIVALAKAGA
jgi:HlyD family secretion protein